MANKRAVSPLVATFMLVVFALIIGTVAMAWGKNYVPAEMQEAPDATLCMSLSTIDTPLKELQVKHVMGQISEEEYLKQEQAIVNS
ncbi:MAG: hypothetical protein Q7S65_01755 [Nanoarchaeota archaeon]|nr:hypothetical protein [Nanoarchaeota archaeon]